MFPHVSIVRVCSCACIGMQVHSIGGPYYFISDPVSAEYDVLGATPPYKCSLTIVYLTFVQHFPVLELLTCWYQVGLDGLCLESNMCF